MVDYSRQAKESWLQLPAYGKQRYDESSRMFKDEIHVLEGYEQLGCRVALVLGKNKPQDLTDSSLRDIFADVFSSLYLARDLIFKGYLDHSFPLLRRAFEATCLLQYLAFLPEKAKVWDSGHQINLREIKQFLDSYPMGESAKMLEKDYTFYSRGTHVNRDYIPHRYLGDGNEFVLGAIGVPNLLIVTDYLDRLVGLWFWVMAVTTFNYRELVTQVDPACHENYMELAGKAQAATKRISGIRKKLYDEFRDEDSKR